MMTGTEMNHIAYRGAQPAYQDVISGAAPLQLPGETQVVRKDGFSMINMLIDCGNPMTRSIS